jgi:glucose/arabinose dehydrogenase
MTNFAIRDALTLAVILAVAGIGWYPAAVPGVALTRVNAAAPEAAPTLQTSLTGPNISIGTVVASGLNHPVALAHPGDASRRLFVVEQAGRIRIIQNGALLPAPFLDIAGRVLSGGERGLLGLAFPPGYETKGHFYVDYTRQPDGATVIARYTASGNLADPNSEQPLLTIPQPFANHNGGQLAFGPNDGFLYIAMGDGGSAGDPNDNAQNLNSLLGKILRIDVESGTAPYAIPPSNPFASSATARGEIWDFGLRNPWRFSFDRANGDLYIGDVGQNAFEEIDFEASSSPGGLNFGWRCKEGLHDFNFTGNCPSSTLVDPIAEYGHDLGISVIGGFVYRGAQNPFLAGRYFYGDFGSGRIWGIAKANLTPTTWLSPTVELVSGLSLTSFGEDDQGELYLAEYAGTVRQLRSSSIASLPVILRPGS